MRVRFPRGISVAQVLAAAATLTSSLAVTVWPALQGPIEFSPSVTLEWLGTVAMLWVTAFAADNLCELRRTRQAECEPLLFAVLITTVFGSCVHRPVAPASGPCLNPPDLIQQAEQITALRHYRYTTQSGGLPPEGWTAEALEFDESVVLGWQNTEHLTSESTRITHALVWIRLRDRQTEKMRWALATVQRAEGNDDWQSGGLWWGPVQPAYIFDHPPRGREIRWFVEQYERMSFEPLPPGSYFRFAGSGVCDRNWLRVVGERHLALPD